MVKMQVMDVVSLSKMGTPGSFYLLVPLKLKEDLNVDTETEFVVLSDGRNILYKPKIAHKQEVN
ncbi:MAG: hypothetical protein NWF06_00775 [Candidatus Bathyarchaeota archaeon]|nr:hypothetical protein [Candidatus Bathyarchaeum sp.]